MSVPVRPLVGAIRPEESAHSELWEGCIGLWDFSHGIFWKRSAQPNLSLLGYLIILALLAFAEETWGEP